MTVLGEVTICMVLLLYDLIDNSFELFSEFTS